MDFPVEASLELLGVHDAGIANLERIVLLARQDVDLGLFGLMIGFTVAGGHIPLRDNFLWFGNTNVNAGDWIFVYTAPGEPRISDGTIPGQKIYSVHWDKPETIFQNKNLTPAIFHMDMFFAAERNDALDPARGQKVGDVQSLLKGGPRLRS